MDFDVWCASVDLLVCGVSTDWVFWEVSVDRFKGVTRYSICVNRNQS